MLDVSRELTENKEKSNVEVNNFSKEIASEVQQKKRMYGDLTVPKLITEMSAVYRFSPMSLRA